MAYLPTVATKKITFHVGKYTTHGSYWICLRMQLIHPKFSPHDSGTSFGGIVYLIGLLTVLMGGDSRVHKMLVKCSATAMLGCNLQDMK